MPKVKAEVVAGVPRVLVVDDVAGHARITAIGLQVEGFEVDVAPDSDTAVRMLGERPYDLAIVDLMMPGTNGMQLCRMMRDRHPETRVVLTSAYHLSERQLLRADCGAVGFVPKPFDLSDLATFLRAKLRPSEAPSPLVHGAEGRERGAAA